ncbi:putative adhesin [Herbihabitans rhizosphaerae]|uniref:Putative adhesin n=1 Tax=Herbihabitans rhizosphaerae TaxID=1872711 RepID=A0A4Q7KF61_9PSEU|nr:DUF4097 family beta strand repeat-containing protein [Herbihabitans rhizosphaerae]RZS31161.1 putative adhesin [Herbihabitans rhizosphaerae]
MPNFDTPNPISATIELVVGNTRITASDRGETVVEVRPSDPDNQLDVKAADKTTVDLTNGGLLVKTPKLNSFFSSKVGSIEVTVELPAGSTVTGETSIGEFHADGRFGECRFKTAMGTIRLAETGPLHVKTTGGKVVVDRVNGRAEITSSNGEVRVGRIDGPAVIKNANGDIDVGDVTGDLRCNTANGNIAVQQALAGVNAKTVNGSVRIGEIVRGEVVVDTTAGELEIGIRKGTAAWLDVKSVSGRVHSSLDSASGPESSEETVKLRARTITGDIVIGRS